MMEEAVVGWAAVLAVRTKRELAVGRDDCSVRFLVQNA
jgi:hypothetical protein